MIPNIGPLEIGVLLLLAILLFGPRRLPELGHGLGKGIREFRDGIGMAGDRGAKDSKQVAAENPNR